MPIKPGAEPFSYDGGQIGVVLSHGFTGSPKSMTPWGQYLADAGFTVRVPRLPGHGTTWQEMNETGAQDWYGEIERNYSELSKRCEHVFVMGLSMGGALALRLAEEKGDGITGVVVVNAAVHSERIDRHLIPFLRHLVPGFPGISNDIKKQGQDEVAYTKIPLKAVYSLMQFWKLIRRDIAKVDQPILVFRSVDDHVVEPSNAEWIINNVSSKDKEQIELHDSFHVATLDNDAPLIFKTSVDFLQRVLLQTG